MIITNSFSFPPSFHFGLICKIKFRRKSMKNYSTAKNYSANSRSGIILFCKICRFFFSTKKSSSLLLTYSVSGWSRAWDIWVLLMMNKKQHQFKLLAFFLVYPVNLDSRPLFLAHMGGGVRNTGLNGKRRAERRR